MVEFILVVPLTCSLYLTKGGDIGAATRGHNDTSSSWSDGGFFRTYDETDREREGYITVLCIGSGQNVSGKG